MRNSALLVAGMVAVLAVAGCSDTSVSSPNGPEQSLTSETLPATQGGAEGDGASDAGSPIEAGSVGPDEAASTPAPTVAVQEPGSTLVVTGAQLAPPDGWEVSGVSSDDRSEVVTATSDSGQFVSLRSVRTDASVDQQIAGALEADGEQSVEAAEVEVDGETLRGVETSLTTSGGQMMRLQFFVRRGESLVTIDIVTAAEEKGVILEHLSSALAWR